MAISLKQLYLLNEYWTTTDFTHPETGEKETAQHWEPSSGYKLYRSPNIDVTKRAANDAKTREKSTQMFYDFYAMELLHALVGSSKEMTAGAKMKATLPLAARTGINPALVGIDWDNVSFPLSNVVLPEKLRSQIDTMYEEVTISLSNKLQEHLRRSLVQELRHLINHSSSWQNFRNDIISHYNKTGTLTKEDLAKFVSKRIPGMSKHLDAVKRLLVFSRHYSKMGGNDPGDIATKDDPKPSKEKDDSSKYHDIEKDSKAVDISKKKEDEPEEEPGEEIPDYQGWEPEAGTTDFDPEDPFSKKIKKQWKDKLKEDYASGKISPSTIRTINKAINKAGVKWEDIVLAYNNIDWNGGYGGEKWGEGVVSYLKLVQASKSQSIDKMASTIDHIYDLSHNNGPLLNKGGMYVPAEDLDRRSKVTHIARFLPNVSPVVRQLILNVMRYLPGTNIEVEKNIDTFLNAPTVPFSEEQKAKLIQYHLSQYIGDTFVGKAPFTNKQGSYVDRSFLVRAHTNGKFTIGDSMKADSKVFDTFEQLEQYLKDVISKEVEPSSGGSSASAMPPAATMAGEIDNYIKSHTRVKLPSDKAQMLLDQCKMGWREKGQYYKAYFNGNKRAMFYAFSDGNYLAITNEYNSFNPTPNWDAILEFTKQLTVNAIPYPEPEKAKAHIAAGTSMASIAPTTPLTTPSTPITGIDVQTTFATPPATPQASVTPTAYPTVANQLPPNATSSAAYEVHSGLSYAPPTTVRLTKPDEDAIVKIGFNPKLIHGMVWYIHKGTGDTVKFYPNNSAKVLFNSGKFASKLSGSGSKPPIVITFTIPKMLQWLQQKYTSETTVSPISEPAPKATPEKSSTTSASAGQGGINPGSLFNPQIQAAGFKWDQSTGTYIDGSNSLLIKPNRSSLLYFGDGQMKQFKNLPELIAYLGDEYPNQKKTNAVETSDSLSDFQFEQIKKSIEQFSNWKAEKHTGIVLVKQLEPNSKTYVTKYGVSKNDNEFRLYNASLGTVIDSSDLFGVVVATLVNQINYLNNPPNPSTNPTAPGFPEVSNSDTTFTTEELEYINEIVVSYGGKTNYSDSNYNEYYISIVPPANGNFLKGAKYYINKQEGQYRIIKSVGEEILFKSPGFYSIIEKLKQILAEEGGTGGTSASDPNKPSPSDGGESPNPNYQATINELIAEVANAIKVTPDVVSKTRSFKDTQYTIPVIKAIRTFYKNNNLDYALGSAKLAAYHWEDFLAYVRDHGLPPMTEGGTPRFQKYVIGYSSKKKQPSIPTLDELVSELSKSTGLTSDAILNSHLGTGSTATKVSAIKTLLSFYKKYDMGNNLAYAKTAIENWPNFLAYVKDTGSFPYVGTPFFDKAIKYSPSKSSTTTTTNSLSDDEKEWITTFFASKYPHLEVDLAPDGIIYINQPDPNVIKEITKGYKPLFIIYKGGPTAYVIRTTSGGEKAFVTFSEFKQFISSKLGTLIPPVQKTPKQIGWEKALEHNYGGVNMDGVSTGANLVYHGFGWSEKNSAYVNNNLYQLVVIKPQIGFNRFYVIWVNKNGESHTVIANDTSGVYSAIGSRGSIAKGEKATGTYSPTPEQEKLLDNMGFVKNTTQTSPIDPITYIKESGDSGNAYFTIDFDPKTGKVKYIEVDEEGEISDGMDYPSFGHLLTFLKNKFADELKDENEKEDEHITHISEELGIVGFIFKNTDGHMYEFYSLDKPEYVSYNKISGTLTYGTVLENGAYNDKKVFDDVDEFVNYYRSRNKNSDLSFIEKFGFKIINNTDNITQWRRDATDTDINEYYVYFIKSSKFVKYEVVNSNTEVEILKKSFTDIEDAIAFLKFRFDFEPSPTVPYSETDYKTLNQGESPYQTIRLTQFDESVLNDIGFIYTQQISIGHTPTGDPVYVKGYQSSDGRQLFIYGDGTALFKNKSTDTGILFQNVKYVFEYLWGKVDWNKIPEINKKAIKWKLSANPIVPTKSGEMPYSGYDYSLLTSLYDQNPIQSTYISQVDEETLKKIGFERKSFNTPDILFQRFYEKGKEKMYFLCDGRAVYWDGNDGPKYIDNVKDGMQFLWNKHTTYIEEVATYKNFMNHWIH